MHYHYLFAPSFRCFLYIWSYNHFLWEKPFYFPHFHHSRNRPRYVISDLYHSIQWKWTKMNPSNSISEIKAEVYNMLSSVKTVLSTIVAKWISFFKILNWNKKENVKMIPFGKIPNRILHCSMHWQIRPYDMCPTFSKNLFGSKFLIKPKEIINESIIKSH